MTEKQLDASTIASRANVDISRVTAAMTNGDIAGAQDVGIGYHTTKWVAPESEAKKWISRNQRPAGGLFGGLFDRFRIQQQEERVRKAETYKQLIGDVIAEKVEPDDLATALERFGVTARQLELDAERGAKRIERQERLAQLHDQLAENSRLQGEVAEVEKGHRQELEALKEKHRAALAEPRMRLRKTQHAHSQYRELRARLDRESQDPSLNKQELLDELGDLERRKQALDNEFSSYREAPTYLAKAEARIEELKAGGVDARVEGDGVAVTFFVESSPGHSDPRAELADLRRNHDIRISNVERHDAIGAELTELAQRIEDIKSQIRDLSARRVGSIL